MKSLPHMTLSMDTNYQNCLQATKGPLQL